MEKKWHTTRSDTLLQDPWINLRADHCVTPAGHEISPYYVLSYPDWVHVVAITEAGSLGLVRQYRHAAGEFLLELPGGAADPKDTNPEQAACRELEEETGFSAQRWELITSLYPNPATHTNRVHFYLALGAVCNRPQGLDTGEEELSVELLNIPTVLDGLKTGLIGQATHVSGILLGLAAAGYLNLTAVSHRDF